MNVEELYYNLEVLSPMKNIFHSSNDFFIWQRGRGQKCCHTDRALHVLQCGFYCSSGLCWNSETKFCQLAPEQIISVKNMVNPKTNKILSFDVGSFSQAYIIYITPLPMNLNRLTRLFYHHAKYLSTKNVLKVSTYHSC